MKNSVKSILKRSITAALAALLAIMSFAIAGCSNSEDDLDYVKKNGKLVIGITEYPPMDYQESGSDEWVGFDADMAKAFAESLGVKAEFVVIDWGTKIAALKGKTIDCVWNGMTLNDEVAAGMGVSKEYCKNAQVVILPADKVNDYQTLDSLKGLKIAVEGGSEGEKQAKALGCETVAVSDQTKAVMYTLLKNSTQTAFPFNQQNPAACLMSLKSCRKAGRAASDYRQIKIHFLTHLLPPLRRPPHTRPSLPW